MTNRKKTFLNGFAILIAVGTGWCSCNNDTQPRHETAVEKRYNAEGVMKNTLAVFDHFGITINLLDCQMVGDTRESYCICEVDSNKLNLIRQKFDLQKLSENEKEGYYKSTTKYGELLNSLKPFSDIKKTTIYKNKARAKHEIESTIYAFCVYETGVNNYPVCILKWTHE